jgi:DNA-binding CsgD family transcriptional regulator
MGIQDLDKPTDAGRPSPPEYLESPLAAEDCRPIPEKVDQTAVEHALGERIKELNCLYGIAGLVDRCGGSIDRLLGGVVELLPGSWQYPEVACAQVTFDGREYQTANYRPSRWRQAADLRVGSKVAGVVEVCYLRKQPIHDEGPFLKEERLLIGAVSERLGRAIDRIRAEQQLEVERAALRNMNIALKEVLARAQEEKADLRRAIQANVDKIVIPILDALESEVSYEQRKYLTLLRGNLEEITSPFADKLSRKFMRLTPTEIRICDMVRRGLVSKEISLLRGISLATVSRHREHIRRKLGLTNEPVNLATYLHTFMLEDPLEDAWQTEDQVNNGSTPQSPRQLAEPQLGRPDAGRDPVLRG